MSSNRKKYDNCCVKDQVKQSTKPFDLLMDSCAYEHKNACRMDIGLMPGNDVSTVGNARHANNGELIDVDSMLKGLDKYPTDCNQEQKRFDLNIGKSTNLNECNFMTKPSSSSNKVDSYNRCK